MSNAEVFEKMDLSTPDLVHENAQKIAQLFPNCVVESRASDGTVKHSIDFDTLKQELSHDVASDDAQRYQMTWPGKAESVIAGNAPIDKTLRPSRDESVDFDTTKNLFIEGDNLDALKLLQETYLGKVKMIYIDPPYNTGKDFVYKDNFKAKKEDFDEDSDYTDEEGGRLVSNPESNGRYHSDWLSMIYPRLRLARNLLKDDGVIFISIDDNEQHNLRKLCDEVFGEDNFVSSLYVEMSKTQGMKVASALKGNIVKNGEIIHVYAKNKDTLNFINILYVEKEWDSHYSLYYDINNKEKTSLLDYIKKNYMKFNIKANIKIKDIEKEYKNNDAFRKQIHYISKNIYQDTMCDISLDLNIEQKNILSNGEYLEYINDNKTYILKQTSSGTFRQLIPLSIAIGETDSFSKKYGLRTIRGDWWSGFYQDMMNISKEGDVTFKNGKKPIRLLTNILKIATQEDDVVIDFFAGSGTTAHAVIALNAEDGGNRKCISVQLPEVTDSKSEAYKAGYKTIAEISKERIRRAGKKILADNAESKEPKDLSNLDTGFRVLKVATGNRLNIKDVPSAERQEGLFDKIGNIKSDRSGEDLLFGVMLDWGIDLSLPIETLSIGGKTVYAVYDRTDVENTYPLLMACFSDDITDAFTQEIATNHTPMSMVFKDESFRGNDSAKINTAEIFKTISPNTKVKVI